MKALSISGLVSLVVLLSACAGPAVSTVSMSPAPARAADCALEFAEIDLAQVNVDKEWTIVGYVSVAEEDIADPFSEEYREIVRPRACELGGTAVALGLATSNEAARGYSAASSTLYAVLVPYTEKKDAAPSQF